MTLIRSEQQASLNELGAALQEAADHFHHAADTLDNDVEIALMQELAAEHLTCADRVAGAVRELGDLPATPDADREAAAHLVQRLATLFSTDGAGRILEQRLAAEQHLAELAAHARQAGLHDDHQSLVTEIAGEIRKATDRLETALLRHQK